MMKLVNAEKGEKIYDIPDEQPPLHYPIDYVLRTWLEHKYYHTYPEAGGYNDQCLFLMADWGTLTMYHIRVENGVFTEIVLPDVSDAPSWLDMGRD